MFLANIKLGRTFSFNILDAQNIKNGDVMDFIAGIQALWSTLQGNYSRCPQVHEDYIQ